MFSNLICRSNITKCNNDENFNNVVNAAKIISSGISINVQNKVNHKI
jgi:hypothetical protein